MGGRSDGILPLPFQGLFFLLGTMQFLDCTRGIRLKGTQVVSTILSDKEGSVLLYLNRVVAKRPFISQNKLAQLHHALR